MMPNPSGVGKPDHVKAIAGTLRKDRANPDAPQQASDAPRVPYWLEGEAAEWFEVLVDRMRAIGLASSTYTETLAMAATRILEVEKTTEIIQREGRVYETSTAQGDRKLSDNPAVSQRSQALRHLHSLLGECGLTPTSITKVSTQGGKPAPSNPWDGM